MTYSPHTFFREAPVDLMEGAGGYIPHHVKAQAHEIIGKPGTDEERV